MGRIVLIGKTADLYSAFLGSNPSVTSIFREMAERLKAAVLKTVDVKASVGSNPTLSAI